MESIGSVYSLKREIYWEIENFFSFPKKWNVYCSPSFSFAGASWCLKILPYNTTCEYVGVYIHREKRGAPINLTWSFCLKTVSGEKIHKIEATNTFRAGSWTWGDSIFLTRSTLSEKKSELVPCDVLTIVFTAETCSKAIDETDPPKKRFGSTVIFVIAIVTAYIYAFIKSPSSFCPSEQSSPQLDLKVTDIGSTYIEIHWGLPEELKTNTARYSVYFRVFGLEWQEISFPNASQTSYNLTNLDPGVLYQIYVVAVDTSGISNSSEKALVRTSSKAIYSFPQLDLTVTNIGSTYIEIHWDLLDELKTSVARYFLYWRVSGAKWNTIVISNTSETFCNLTNLDPGIPYQVYVTAVGISGINISSEKATFQTAYQVIHEEMKEESYEENGREDLTS